MGKQRKKTNTPQQSHFRWLSVFVITLSMLMPIGAAAQSGAVAGRVLGESGEPLPNVVVEIVELGLSTQTNDNGSYQISDVAAGSYTLRFSALDRNTEERSVIVGAGVIVVPDTELSIVAISLAPLEVLEQRVRITSTPELIPGSAQVLETEELDAAITPFDDIHKIVRRIPGVNVSEEDGYGLRPNIGIRGSGSERSSKITLMEDGVLIAPAPYAAPSAYYFPVAGRMEAIEVRKGASQIKYGPRTVGGALNLVSSSIPTKKIGLTGEISGAPDASNRLRAKIGGSTDRFGWMAETYQIKTDGFKTIPVQNQGSGFDIKDYLAKVRWNSDPTAADFYQQLEVKFGSYDERSDETYLGLTDADFRSNPFQRYAASQEDVMNADQQQLQVRHFLRSGGMDLTTTIYRNDFARNWYKLQTVSGQKHGKVLGSPHDFPTEMAIIKGANSPGADVKLRANNREYYGQGIQVALGTTAQAFGADHEFEVGVRYHRDEEDRMQHEDGYRMIDADMVLEAPGARGSQSNRVSDATAVAFYIQDRMEFGDLALTPGLRFESIDFTRTDYAKDDPTRKEPTRIRENGVNAIMPGIGATLTMGSNGRLFGGIHRGFAPPGPGADDDTEAERSVNYELGFGLDNNNATTQFVAFYNDYSNVLGEATIASGTELDTGELFNGGSARIWGLEASTNMDLATGSEDWSVPLQVAYTFTNATFRTAFDSKFDPWGEVAIGDNMPYIPEHMLFSSIGVARDNWRLGLEITASSAMRTEAGSGDIPATSGTDSYIMLGLGGEVDLSSWGSLFMSAHNLNNTTHIVARRPAGVRPGLPRMVEAGIRFAF